MTMRSFRCIDLSKRTVPSISAMTAAFLGFLASKSSLTRGKPPVMSFDLVTAFGIFAKISAFETLSPSFTLITALASSK